MRLHRLRPTDPGLGSRYCWKPYVRDPSLPPLRERLRELPTLLVWGRDDRVVPVEAGQLYQRAIAEDGPEIIDHRGLISRPAEFRQIA